MMLATHHFGLLSTGFARAFVVACGLTTSLAWAADPPATLSKLAFEKHCDECHAVAAARIGPPFIAIASRHRAEGPAAIEPLTQKIIHGGAGNWGVVPMVPNERVTPDEARELVRWILSLYPG
jgi:cytochrome c